MLQVSQQMVFGLLAPLEGSGGGGGAMLLDGPDDSTPAAFPVVSPVRGGRDGRDGARERARGPAGLASGGSTSPLHALRRPEISFSLLIGLAILESPAQRLSVGDIYRFLEARFPYFAASGPSWKNSVRHNLSTNQHFCKVPAPAAGALSPGPGSPARGTQWAVRPESLAAMQQTLRRHHTALVQFSTHYGGDASAVHHAATAATLHELSPLPADDMAAAAAAVAATPDLQMVGCASRGAWGVRGAAQGSAGRFFF
jgi:hypothetical protein